MKTSELLEKLRHKQSWFEGKWSLDDRQRPEYVPCVDLLRWAIAEIERQESLLNAHHFNECFYEDCERCKAIRGE